MVSRGRLHKILDLVMEIQERGRGADGYPYVSFDTNNYSRDICVYGMKNGFTVYGDYDINIYINDDADADLAIKELERLLEIAADRVGE